VHQIKSKAPYGWFDVKWNEGERPEEHNKEFGDAVKEALQESIESVSNNSDEQVNRPGIDNFVSPERFDEIKAACFSDQPVLVYGKGGTGKSTLLSKLVEEFESPSQNKKVYDFWVGLNEKCATGVGLLREMIARVNPEYANDLAGKNFYELSQILNEVSEEFDENVLIVIDALDQLPEGDPAKALYWIPKSVHLLCSTLDGNIKRKLESKGTVLKINGLPKGEENGLLNNWLEEAGRQLTSKQEIALLNMYNGTPLHLKILFERAKFLKSYDPLPSWLEKKGDEEIETETSIKALFDHLALKENHGQEMVARTLSYIAS